MYLMSNPSLGEKSRARKAKVAALKTIIGPVGKAMRFPSSTEEKLAAK